MKSVHHTCPECDSKYTITAEGVESVQFCPFCGEGALMPYDDLDDDELLDDEDDEDETGEW